MCRSLVRYKSRLHKSTCAVSWWDRNLGYTNQQISTRYNVARTNLTHWHSKPTIDSACEPSHNLLNHWKYNANYYWWCHFKTLSTLRFIYCCGDQISVLMVTFIFIQVLLFEFCWAIKFMVLHLPMKSPKYEFHFSLYK